MMIVLRATCVGRDKVRHAASRWLSPLSNPQEGVQYFRLKLIRFQCQRNHAKPTQANANAVSKIFDQIHRPAFDQDCKSPIKTTNEPIAPRTPRASQRYRIGSRLRLKFATLSAPA